MPDYDPAIRTRTLARVVGPCLVVTAAALCLRRDTLPDFLSSFMHGDAPVFVTGAFAFVVGMTILTAHHHWSSFSATLISFIGVAGALWGASLMIAPGFGAEMTHAAARTPLSLQAAVGLEFLLGLWLTFVGWAREHVVFAFALNR